MKRRQHPSKEITGTDGSELCGRKIVLCITGSVAAYRAIDMVRLLMRHGAEVHAVMTESTSSLLLTSEMMKWATGNDVVTKLTGNLEHIALADYGMSDLVLVYPCTANTIGKFASGIDDTTVTSVLSVAFGSKIPIIIAPAMHEAMYENVIIQQNVIKLRDNGITIVEPEMAEGKAKVAEPAQVFRVVKDVLSRGPLSGKKILVTAGSTIEHIDPIRVITNTSSGKMGIAIAAEAEKMGASATLVYGHGSADPDVIYGKVLRVNTAEEMNAAVGSELASKNYDIVVMAAAVADFSPARRTDKKIETRSGRVELALEPTRKIVDGIKKMSKHSLLVAFKADYGVSESILTEKAFKKLQECDADFIVANDLGKKGSGAGSDQNEVLIIDKNKQVIRVPLQSKAAVARK
ncbi:MAG TPA: bifunctional phosphopantothenoylcysteine decarboxylase/phosphopantothenate--cysteine ligase CoaBC, partial [Nitrososphaera sp.]